MELVGAAGLDSIEQLEPKHINRRIQGTDVKTYAQLYPTISNGCLLDEKSIPSSWEYDWNEASAETWS